MILAQPNIMVRVLPLCMRLPLTSSHMSRACGSAISSVGDEPGADRAEGVEALALVPLRGRHLERALGDVVDDAVAGDVVSASASVTYCACVPMTMPSSTSQSSLVEFFGCITSSFGPLMQVVAFMNTIGSVGTGMPASSAWSE